MANTIFPDADSIAPTEDAAGGTCPSSVHYLECIQNIEVSLARTAQTTQHLLSDPKEKGSQGMLGNLDCLHQQFDKSSEGLKKSEKI